MSESNNDFLSRSMGQFKSAKAQKVTSEPRKQNEWTEQLVFCKYLKTKYPNLIYRSDLHSAGAKTVYMQNLVKILQSGSGFPDTQIYEPVGNYCGLMIELKKKPKTQSESIYLKDGNFKSNEHVFNQAEMHHNLRSKRWCVKFAQGADEAISFFESYMRGEL